MKKLSINICFSFFISINIAFSTSEIGDLATQLEDFGLSADYRKKAAHMLLLLDDPAVYPHLHTILTDRDGVFHDLRPDAIKALGKLALSYTLTDPLSFQTRIIQDLRTIILTQHFQERGKAETAKALIAIATNSSIEAARETTWGIVEEIVRTQRGDELFLTITQTLSRTAISASSSPTQTRMAQLLREISLNISLPDDYRTLAISSLRLLGVDLSPIITDESVPLTIRKAAGLSELSSSEETDDSSSSAKLYPLPTGPTFHELQELSRNPAFPASLQPVIAKALADGAAILRESFPLTKKLGIEFTVWKDIWTAAPSALHPIILKNMERIVSEFKKVAIMAGTPEEGREAFRILQAILSDSIVPTQVCVKAISAVGSIARYALKEFSDATPLTTLRNILINNYLPIEVRLTAVWKYGRIAANGRTPSEAVRSRLWKTLLDIYTHDPSPAMRLKAIDGMGSVAIGQFPDTFRIGAFGILQSICGSPPGKPPTETMWIEKAIPWLGSVSRQGKTAAIRVQAHHILTLLPSPQAKGVLEELAHLLNGGIQAAESRYRHMVVTLPYWFAKRLYDGLCSKGCSAPFLQVSTMPLPSPPLPPDIVLISNGSMVMAYNPSTQEVLRLKPIPRSGG